MLHKELPPMPAHARKWAKTCLFRKLYIFYDRKSATEGFCTGCEQVVPLQERAVHKKNTICPNCGVATMVASWYGRKWMQEHDVCLIIQPMGKGLLLRESGCYASYESGRFEPIWYDDDLTLFSGGSYIREINNDYRGWHTVKQLKRKAGSRLVMFDNLNGTEFENCPLHTFINGVGSHPAKFIRMYQRRPKIEHLVRAGLFRVVQDILNGMNGINWKGRRPRDMLGLTGPEVQSVRIYNHGLKEIGLYKKYPDLFQLDRDAVILQNLNGYDFRWIWSESDFRFAVKYAQKNIRRGMPTYRVGSWLLDTRRMLTELGHDMTKPYNWYPPDLEKAHERALKDYRALQRAKSEKEWEKEQDIWDRIAEKLSPLCWEDGGLMIRPVASRKELVREGDMLEHCVASYADQIKRENSYILLIRRTDDPETPYFTLNLSPDGRIIQCHGYKNDRLLPGSIRPQEIRDFEKRWLAKKVEPWLKGKRKDVPKCAS